MKYATACITAFVLLLCFSGVGLAHRVNIFAYADGDAILVECSFSKSQKVRHGKLIFTDLATGATLLEGTTDEQGLFRFRPEPEFLKTGHGVNILLNAGEGHQSDWQVSPEELAALSPSGEATPREARPAATPSPDTREIETRPAATPSPDARELEALIGRVMDAKLAPIKQSLARQEDRGPSLKDVIGGLGWILGLLGLATYMKYRR